MSLPPHAITSAVVQFPHPGQEHRPSSAITPRAGKHGRRFVFTGATGFRGNERLHAPASAWVEFEYGTATPIPAETNIDPNWVAGNEKHLPQTILRELQWSPSKILSMTNTCGSSPGPEGIDPNVFAPAFVYSGACKQFTKTTHRPTLGKRKRKVRPSKLRWLGPGSLILFGSQRKVAGEFAFVLDTVLVVQRVVDTATVTRDAILCDPVLGAPGAAAGTWRTVNHFSDTPFAERSMMSVGLEGGAVDCKCCPTSMYKIGPRAMVGATPEQPVMQDGVKMFSFIPGKFASDGKPAVFPRPVISLDSVPKFNPKSGQTASIVADGARAAEIWTSVRQQCVRQGCDLITGLASPTCADCNGANANCDCSNLRRWLVKHDALRRQDLKRKRQCPSSPVNKRPRIE